MSEFTDLFPPRSVFARTTECPIFCEGHVDESVTSHGTEYDFFGPDGVVVTQAQDKPPVVSLIDFNPVQHDFTPAHARRLAYQILQAAELAERYTQPCATAHITRLLAATIAAETTDEG